MTPSFLPWHRRFLLEFETELRRVDPTVSVPYWDWTRDNSPASSIWGEDFMGGNGRRADFQVMTGPFAHSSGRWTITQSMTDGRFLTRDFGRPHDPIALPTQAQLDEVMRERAYDAAPWNSTSASGFRNRLEGWAPGRGNERFRIHNRVHRWVGGLMLGGGSVNDPVFWLHHSFVDLVWSRWQQRNPGAAYLPHGAAAARGRAVPEGRRPPPVDGALGCDPGVDVRPQPDLPVRLTPPHTHVSPGPAGRGTRSLRGDQPP